MHRPFDLIRGLSLLVCLSSAWSAMADERELQAIFDQAVRPLLQTYCFDCHGADEPEAKLDLTEFSSMQDVARSLALWRHVTDRIGAGEMPPEGSDRPSPPEIARLLEWSRSIRRSEANRHAGDPGPVLAHRLNAAEYNNTIRDLTGHDIRPAIGFPVDPANEAGFDNTGESLTMTPALLGKYIDAARMVADHLVMCPDGIRFASHPVLTETDRDKYCVRRIIDFYARQNTNYADYFYAAWLQQHDPPLTESFQAFVNSHHLSQKYLAAIEAMLTGDDDHAGPIAKVRELWQAIPKADRDTTDGTSTAQAMESCRAISDYVTSLRRKLQFDFPRLSVQGIGNGSQPLVLWRNRQFATHRRTLNEAVLVTDTPSTSNVPHAPDTSEPMPTPGSDDQVSHGAEADTHVSDPELTLPGDPVERQATLAAFRHFCNLFPDTFFVEKRGREFLDRDDEELEKEKSVRLLSAGFHSMMGYFRDDAPLYELMLDSSDQQLLDQLWWELDFIANAPARQHAGFLWYERGESRFLGSAEFDFIRAEDKDAAHPEKLQKLAELYIAKAITHNASEVAVEAMHEHFRRTSDNLQRVEDAIPSAERMQVAGLEQLAQRAYRRPLRGTEQSDIHEFYRTLREENGLSHEDALRDVVVSILMSPHFCYVTHISDSDVPVHELNDVAVASRLSYFLWATMPDEELMRTAAAGKLRRGEQLQAQVGRMVQDERIRGLATEFAGQWLGFRAFEQHNSVDRNRFPEFNDALRQAMFDEPIRFFIDLVRRDGSVWEFLDADHTFVNVELARHYGIEFPEQSAAPDQWQRIEHASAFQRGGLLPMAVFLTQHSPGLRTSPVKRGYWVVRQLLGEHIPPPPPEVPVLPNDESSWGELSLRELLAKHREHASCAGCHNRFDSLGLAFEGYGPVGESRQLDLGGRAVETLALYPDQLERAGVAGLREYLRDVRRDDFLDNLCRKFLSYALGRSLIISDDLLLEQMHARLAEADYRMSAIIETIVTSPQFLTTRGRNYRPEE